MNTRIQLHKGDITKLNCDAIVNAANTSLLGGGGVDGAIHRSAGPELLEECRLLNGCATGESKLTKGYRLPAHYVIHTVGPVWRGGNNREAILLKSCYQSALEIACSQKMGTVAFPNISTGVYGYPKTEAARIAIDTVNAFLHENEFPQKVIFALFDEDNLHIYQQLLKEI